MYRIVPKIPCTQSFSSVCLGDSSIPLHTQNSLWPCETVLTDCKVFSYLKEKDDCLILTKFYVNRTNDINVFKLSGAMSNEFLYGTDVPLE